MLRFVSNTGDNDIIKPTKVFMEEDKPMVITISLKENKITSFKYFATKNSVKKFLEFYNLEIHSLFLQEGADGYDKMRQACTAAVYKKY